MNAESDSSSSSWRSWSSPSARASRWRRTANSPTASARARRPTATTTSRPRWRTATRVPRRAADRVHRSAGRRRDGRPLRQGRVVGDAVLDPTQPEALVYEPEAARRFKLVALEYIVFKDVWMRPTRRRRSSSARSSSSPRSRTVSGWIRSTRCTRGCSAGTPGAADPVEPAGVLLGRSWPGRPGQAHRPAPVGPQGGSCAPRLACASPAGEHRLQVVVLLAVEVEAEGPPALRLDELREVGERPLLTGGEDLVDRLLVVVVAVSSSMSRTRFAQLRGQDGQPSRPVEDADDALRDLLSSPRRPGARGQGVDQPLGRDPDRRDGAR